MPSSFLVSLLATTPRRAAECQVAALAFLGGHSRFDRLRVGLWLAFLWGTPTDIAHWVQDGASPDMPFPTHHGLVTNERHAGRSLLHVAARHRDRLTGSGGLDGYAALLSHSRLPDQRDLKL